MVGVVAVVVVVVVVSMTTCLSCCFEFLFVGFLARDLDVLEDLFFVAVAPSGLFRAAAASASRLSLAFLKI